MFGMENLHFDIPVNMMKKWTAGIKHRNEWFGDVKALLWWEKEVKAIEMC